MTLTGTVVLDLARCRLGEGPSCDPAIDTAWWVDLLEARLFEMRLDVATGLPADEPETHDDHRAGPGGIDSAVTDGDGLIRTARFGAGRLDPYSPAGERVRTVPVPAWQPTCPTFAQRGLDRVLVTAACDGMNAGARAADHEQGRKLVVDVGARGLLEPAFRPGA